MKNLHEHLLSQLGLTITVLIILALVISQQPVFAQDTAAKITITDQQVTQVWRKSMTFTAKAISEDSKIATARIVIMYPGQTYTESYRVPAFTPAKSLDLKYEWKLQSVSTPPWQFFYYYWELADSTGRKIRTDKTQIEFVDDSRDWKHLEGKGIAVYWYGKPDRIGKHVLNMSQRAFDTIAKRMNYQPNEQLRVIIYNSQKDFCTFMAAYECKDWYGGITYGNVTLQWYEPYGEWWAYNLAIPHEIAHAFVNQRLSGHTEKIPSWFDEGQAMNNEFSNILEYIVIAQRVAREGRLERIQLLDARNTIGRDDSELVTEWYATAASLVTYMYKTYGEDVLGKIITGVDEGKLSFEEAFQQATGDTLETFELEWRKWLGATKPLPTLAPTLKFVFPPTPTYPPTRTPQPTAVK